MTNRHDFLAALAMRHPTRRTFIGTLSGVSPAAQILPAAARCRVLEASGAPVTVDELNRFHICDLLLRPFPIEPKLSPGEVAFTAPERPFRIALPLRVPGFGHTVAYADNGGAGYTAKSWSSGRVLDLNAEFAADRLATVRRLASGISVPARTGRRIESAAALFEQRRYFDSLAESLWAGEELVVERARRAIARNGPRPGFLFGCNAFGYPKLGRRYTELFQAAFNYATLPFYLSWVQRVQGQSNYEGAEQILSWLDGTRILKKGHPLVWFNLFSNLPDWLRNKPFAEVKRLCLGYARDSVRRFRGRIHAWDVINEAHEQNPLGFTLEQQMELTAGAAQAAREGDPTCFRVINCCSTWSEYMRRGTPIGRQAVYDYLNTAKDAGVDFEAIGLQYYFRGRDLVEMERSIETFKSFGKPVHITELGVPSSQEEITNPNPLLRRPWHGDQWTESMQADWVEQFYTIVFSKPWIEAVTWFDLADPGHGCLVRQDLTPKESYRRLLALITGWRKAEGDS